MDHGNIYFCASLKGIKLYVNHLRMRIEIRERDIHYLTYFQWLIFRYESH